MQSVHDRSFTQFVIKTMPVCLSAKGSDPAFVEISFMYFEIILILGNEYLMMKFLIMKFSPALCHFLSLRPSTLPQAPCFETLSACVFHLM